MTAWGSVSLAVEAMRRGARDFIEKPWDNERLLTILRTQTELGRALRRATRLEAQTRRPGRRRADAHRGVAGHAAGPADRGARRPLRRERPDHGRERDRQGPHRAGAARRFRARRAPDGDAQLRRRVRGRFRKRAVRTRQGRLHRRHGRIASAASSSPTAARCSSTKSPTCRSASSRSCFACSRPASSSGWDHRGRARPTCG